MKRSRARYRRIDRKRGGQAGGGTRAIKRFLAFLTAAAVAGWALIAGELPAAGRSAAPGRAVLISQTPSDYIRSVRNAMAVCFSGDGKLMASGGMSDRVVITDMVSGSSRSAAVSAAGMSAVYSMSFSADRGSLAAAGDFGGSNIRIIDMATGSEAASFDESSIVSHVAFSPDGRYLLSVSDYTVRVWDVRNRRLVRVLQDGDMPTKAFFVGDGGHILTNHGLKLWNWVAGEPEKRIVSGGELFRGMNCDGGRCVFAGRDGLSLFDLGTMSVKSLIAGDTGGLTELAYNSRTGLVASIVNDRKLMLIGQSGKVMAGIGIVGPARAISFSPDGGMLALGSGGEDIALYRMKGRESGGDITGFFSGMLAFAKSNLNLPPRRM